MRRFGKLAKMAALQTLWPLQNAQLGSKIKITKNMPQTTLQAH